MTVILRFVCFALLLIILSLFIPDLKLGGRYVILAEAFLGALLAWSVRKWIGTSFLYWKRCFLAGIGTVMALFLGKLLFSGVNLPLLGIITVYLGTVLLEMLLPIYMKRINDSNEGDKTWKQ